MKKIIALAIIAALAAFSASAQIITGSIGITNGSLSAPMQQSFTPVTASESISLSQHAAQIGNVVTNQYITLSYGRQPQGYPGTNLSSFASITTNYTAAWTFTTFGYTTNNFSTTLVFPQVQVQPLDAMWGTFSNNIGSNSVNFY